MPKTEIIQRAAGGSRQLRFPELTQRREGAKAQREKQKCFASSRLGVFALRIQERSSMKPKMKVNEG
jgi:hypothetical protein